MSSTTERLLSHSGPNQLASIGRNATLSIVETQAADDNLVRTLSKYDLQPDPADNQRMKEAMEKGGMTAQGPVTVTASTYIGDVIHFDKKGTRA